MSEKCGRCPHDFDPHAMVATDGNPLHGGIIICPEVGCQCYATWGVGRGSAVPEPLTEVQIQDIREQIQSGFPGSPNVGDIKNVGSLQKDRTRG